MLIDSQIRRAIWIDPRKKRVIRSSLNSDYVKALTDKDREFLCALLCSLLYAERLLKSRGKKVTLWLESLSKILHIQTLCCQTLGMWNFHVTHASRFGFSTKQFRKLLLDDDFATKIVIRHLVEDIKLNKTPDRIFAEYNHCILATSIVALQKAVNCLCKENGTLIEDGILGEETIKKIEENLHFFPPFFSLDKLNEQMILRTLKYFSRKFGIFIEPYVPKLVVKKNLSFLKEVLKKGFRNEVHLKNLKAILERNVDVPIYVKRAMRAYRYLNRHNVIAPS